MNNSNFYIVGKHAVIEALKNPNRKVLKVFLTEESKKNIHRESPRKNLLGDVKVYFKTKKAFGIILLIKIILFPLHLEINWGYRF